MRNKVLAVLSAFAEGGTLRDALSKESLTWQAFYRVLRETPDLMNDYHDHQRNRAEMAGDEILEIAKRLMSTEKDEKGVLIDALDARRARVAGELLGKMMERYSPDRFGQRMNVQVEAKPNLLEAIEAGKRRSLLPHRNLAQIENAQLIDITPTIPMRATDKQSGERTETPILAAPIDPFED